MGVQQLQYPSHCCCCCCSCCLAAAYIIQFVRHLPNNWWLRNWLVKVALNSHSVRIFLSHSLLHCITIALFCSVILSPSLSIFRYLSLLLAALNRNCFLIKKLNKANRRAKHLSHCVSHKQTVTAKARQIGTGRAGTRTEGQQKHGSYGNDNNTKLAGSFSTKEEMLVVNECVAQSDRQTDSSTIPAPGG